jgi:hydrogenase maturation protease
MKTLILGIGNLILTDDGVGIKIAHKLNEARPELEVVETGEAGLTLLDLITGYDRLIIIDSIKTEQGKPGQVYKLELEDLKPAMDFSSSHGIDIATAFKLGQSLGYRMPESVSLYAVEMKDNTTFGERCTQEVEEKIPFIAQQIIDEEKL